MSRPEESYEGAFVDKLGKAFYGFSNPELQGLLYRFRTILERWKLRNDPAAWICHSDADESARRAKFLRESIEQQLEVLGFELLAAMEAPKPKDPLRWCLLASLFDLRTGQQNRQFTWRTLRLYVEKDLGCCIMEDRRLREMAKELGLDPKKRGLPPLDTN